MVHKRKPIRSSPEIDQEKRAKGPKYSETVAAFESAYDIEDIEAIDRVLPKVEG